MLAIPASRCTPEYVVSAMVPGGGAADSPIGPVPFSRSKARAKPTVNSAAAAEPKQANHPAEMKRFVVASAPLARITVSSVNGLKRVTVASSPFPANARLNRTASEPTSKEMTPCPDCG